MFIASRVDLEIERIRLLYNIPPSYILLGRKEIQELEAFIDMIDTLQDESVGESYYKGIVYLEVLKESFLKAVV